MRSRRSSATARRPARYLDARAGIGRCHPVVRRRPRSGARSAAAALHRLLGRARRSARPRLPTERFHDRYPPHPALGDVLALAVPDLGRRGTSTTASRRCSARRPRVAAPAHAGRPAPAPAPRARRRAVPGAAAAATPAIGAPVAAAPPASAAGAPSSRSRSSTDLVRATLDSTGGYARCASSCCKQVDPVDPTEARRAARPARRSASTWPQTGLVPPAGGAGLPNHHTPMHARAGRALAGSRPERAAGGVRERPVGGVKLVKTYTFRRGDYVIDVKHEIVNAVERAGAAAPVPAARARRQRRRRASSSLLLHLHRPGDLHRERAIPEDRLQATSRSAAPARSPTTRPAPTTAGSRWCSTTSPRPG